MITSSAPCRRSSSSIASSAAFGSPIFPVAAKSSARAHASAARGLEPDERLTYSNGVRKALYHDPDGNELGFGGAPLETGS